MSVFGPAYRKVFKCFSSWTGERDSNCSCRDCVRRFQGGGQLISFLAYYTERSLTKLFLYSRSLGLHYYFLCPFYISLTFIVVKLRYVDRLFCQQNEYIIISIKGEEWEMWQVGMVTNTSLGQKYPHGNNIR